MEMNSSTITNFNKICRVCLKESTQMFSIFSELYVEENCEENVPFLSEIIMNVSSMKIQAGDGLPELICSKCVNDAHLSYQFQNCCNRSQAILETYLSRNDTELNCEDNIEIKVQNDAGLSLVLNQNDLDFAENYIKETLIQEGQEVVESLEDPTLNPDEFFATDEECLGVRTETVEEKEDYDKSDVEIGDLEDEKEEDIGNLKNYEKTLPTGEKFFACKMCERIYKNGSSLRAHIKGHHKKQRPFKCGVCGKGFRMYGSFFYHKRTHTGEQPHVCEVCGKKYKQSGTLTAHMRIHTGQRPFLCSICGKGFRQQPDLNYHMRSHTKEKPYQCTVCGKTMSMHSHLVQHMRIHTGERPFKCSDCEKTFPTSTCLKRHQMIHTGQRPFMCEVCLKTFNRSSSLTLHSKTHTDERPHVCHICNKGFIQAHTLKTHLQTHSSEKKKHSPVGTQEG